MRWWGFTTLLAAILFAAVADVRVASAQSEFYDEQLSRLDYDWGVMACQDGDYESAVRLFKQAISKKPDYAEAYYRLGYAAAALDDFENARDAYLKLLELDPKRARQLELMLTNLKTMGRYRMGVGNGGTQGRYSEYLE